MKRQRYLVTVITTIEAADLEWAKRRASRMARAFSKKKPFLHVREKFGEQRAWERAAMGPWQRSKNS